MSLIARKVKPLSKAVHNPLGSNIIPASLIHTGFDVVSLAICLCISTLVVFSQKNKRPDFVDRFLADDKENEQHKTT